MHLGQSDYIKEKAKKRRKTASGEDDLGLSPLQPDGAGYESGGEAGPSSAPAGPKRRTKEQMEEYVEALLQL